MNCANVLNFLNAVFMLETRPDCNVLDQMADYTSDSDVYRDAIIKSHTTSGNIYLEIMQNNILKLNQ